jgi:pSer/pThr/pTyr-binding forkhead associated (FHA) protein
MSGPILLILRALLALALYAFLGWALFTLWRDLKRQSELLASRQPPDLTLTLADGISWRYATAEIILGRDPACDCCLDDPTVSTRHARLIYHHNQWWAEDLRSTNGTFLNQESVSTPVVITSGDELRCGQVVVQVAINSASGG